MSAQAPHVTTKVTAAIALAALAGWVDAVGWLGIGKVFLAHMSGNTASSAIHAVTGKWAESLHRLSPLPGFILGLAAGRVLSDLLGSRSPRMRLRVLLGVESALLLLALVIWGKAPAVALIMSLAAAMGVQSAALRHVAGHDVRTTFVTGMIVAFVDECVSLVLRSGGQPSFARLHAAVWVAFLSGAAGATAAFGYIVRWALVAPLAVIALLLLLEYARPLA